MTITSLIDLGTDIAPTFITNAGQITGGSDQGAFLWQNGTLTTIGGLPGYNGGSVGSYITNDGQVVGVSRNENQTPNSDYVYINQENIFVWKNGSLNSLDLPGVVSNVTLAGVTGTGEIVGSVTTYNNSPVLTYSAFTWTSGVISSLQLPFTPTVVNVFGDIAGIGTDPGSGDLLKNGILTQFSATSSQYTAINPLGINSKDQIVGIENFSTPRAIDAFFWQKGKAIQLPDLPGGLFNYAFSINDSGLIVGDSGPGFQPQQERAVLWQNGVAIDLNSLLPANSGWVLETAQSINSGNQITGVGSYNGTQSGYLITISTPTETVQTLSQQWSAGSVSSVTPVADTAANVAANLDTLSAVLAAQDLGGVTISGSAVPTLMVTAAQLSNDAGVFSHIAGSFNLASSAAGVAANLDSLGTLAASHKLASISLSDGGVPTLSLTAAQVATDGAVLALIAGPYQLDITAPAAGGSVAGLAGTATTIVFSGAAAQYSVVPGQDGASLTVTSGSAALHLSNVTALQFSNTTEILAHTPGSGAAGNVTTGNITELYGAVFGRLPDAAGLAYYQTVLAANPTLSLVNFAQSFLASSEYTSNSAHNYAQTSAGEAQFVTDSYQNLLHRAPEAGAIPYYQNLVAQFTNGLTPGSAAYASADALAHATLLTDFSQSSEFLGDVQITAQTPASPGFSGHWLVLI